MGSMTPQQLTSAMEIWQKLEQTVSVIDLPPDLPNPISYFNNYKKTETSSISLYDRLYHPHQFWDQETQRCDRRNPHITRENIYKEEVWKKVPVVTSFNYGKPCREKLEVRAGKYGRVAVCDQFYNRNGVNIEPDLERHCMITDLNN